MNRVDSTIRETLAMGTSLLKEAGIPEYHLDAQLLLCRLLGIDRSFLFTRENQPVREDVFNLYLQQLQKRAERMPVAYITNTCEFYGLDFYVNEFVLIPRSDTETLVEQVLSYIGGGTKILEIGSGSGCISVALATCLSNVSITASDISPDALKVAKKNADLNGVRDKIRFIESDMFEKLPQDEFGEQDMLVSNPPYIETQEIETLLQDVMGYEPILALDGGADGLNFYRELAERGREFLKPLGGLFLEIGYTQAQAVIEILQNSGYKNIEIKKDLSGLNRVVYGWRG